MTGYDDRARNHIKALIEETKRQASTAPEPAQTFLSGMMTGLASAVEILNGGSAEGSLERVAQRLEAAIGKAYLDGKLPAKPPTVDSPAAVMTTVGAPVTTGVTSGITAPPVQCWHTEAGTPCTSTQCNQPDRRRMGDYGDVPNDQAPDGTTLETPILAEQLADIIENALLAVIPDRVSDRDVRQEVSRRATNDVLALIVPNARHTAGLLRDADADMKRVIALYEQWVKAGPPKLGTPIAREWDRRLAEFHRAIKGPDPTDPS